MSRRSPLSEILEATQEQAQLSAPSANGTKPPAEPAPAEAPAAPVSESGDEAAVHDALALVERIIHIEYEERLGFQIAKGRPEDDLEMISFRVPRWMKRALKRLALDTDVPVQDLGAAAIAMFLREVRKP